MGHARAEGGHRALPHPLAQVGQGEDVGLVAAAVADGVAHGREGGRAVVVFERAPVVAQHREVVGGGAALHQVAQLGHAHARVGPRQLERHRGQPALLGAAAAVFQPVAVGVGARQAAHHRGEGDHRRVGLGQRHALLARALQRGALAPFQVADRGQPAHDGDEQQHLQQAQAALAAPGCR